MSQITTGFGSGAPGPLGFIKVSDRTVAQQMAHQQCQGLLKHYTLPVPTLAKGQSIRLFSFWKDPRVVADLGFEFSWFHQLTGSCVGAGGGNGLTSTICAQRCGGSQAPTKAFLPFWLSAYGMSRHYMGDDGQGEGSLGSTFAKALTTDGIRDWVPGVDGMPSYSKNAGIMVTSQQEMTWSSYRNPSLQTILQTSRHHLLGSAGQCRSAQDIKAMILNGYGVTFACNNYIGRGAVTDGGGTPYVKGHWDGQGGHQQSVHAYWEHPNDGPLYWAQNNWDPNTYPKDPAGGPTCGVWVAERDVDSAIQNLDAEVYGLSHLDWFPANPDILSYYE